MNEKLLATIRYYFAQSVFMNSIHYKAYYRLDKKLKRAKLIVAIISSLTLVLIITNLIILETPSINNNSILKILYFIGMALTGLSLIYEFFNTQDIGELKYHHRHAAEEYKILRDQFMSLIEEIMTSSDSEKKLRIEFHKLQNNYSQLGKSSPTTENADYTDAQSGLGISRNSNEEFTWSDTEIDRFLPLLLRTKYNQENNP